LIGVNAQEEDSDLPHLPRNDRKYSSPDHNKKAGILLKTRVPARKMKQVAEGKALARQRLSSQWWLRGGIGLKRIKATVEHIVTEIQSMWSETEKTEGSEQETLSEGPRRRDGRSCATPGNRFSVYRACRENVHGNRVNRVECCTRVKGKPCGRLWAEHAR